MRETRRERRERRWEEKVMILANLTAIRDAAFWWGGVWAMMTALDVGAAVLIRSLYVRHRRRRRREHQDGDREA